MPTLLKNAPANQGALKVKEKDSVRTMKAEIPERYKHLPYKKGRFLQLNNLLYLLELVKANRFDDAIKTSFEDEKEFITKYNNSSAAQKESIIDSLSKEISILG